MPSFAIEIIGVRRDGGNLSGQIDKTLRISLITWTRSISLSRQMSSDLLFKIQTDINEQLIQTITSLSKVQCTVMYKMHIEFATIEQPILKSYKMKQNTNCKIWSNQVRPYAPNNHINDDSYS